MTAAAPRVFWRRAAATLIDVIAASLLSGLILLPFLGNTDKIRLDNGGIYYRLCKSMESVTPQVFDLIAPDKAVAAILCKTSVFGIDNGLTLAVVTANDALGTTRRLTLAIDENGTPVSPMQPQTPLTLAALVGFGGWLLSRSGQTIGKRLLDLRVTTAHPFQREALKYAALWPSAILAIAATPFAPQIRHALTALPNAGLLAIMAGFGLLLIGYYVLPWLRWRGAMPWDRLSRSVVTRAAKE